MERNVEYIFDSNSKSEKMYFKLNQNPLSDVTSLEFDLFACWQSTTDENHTFNAFAHSNIYWNQDEMVRDSVWGWMNRANTHSLMLYFDALTHYLLISNCFFHVFCIWIFHFDQIFTNLNQGISKVECIFHLKKDERWKNWKKLKEFNKMGEKLKQNYR